jgi:hypothetical protein
MRSKLLKSGFTFDEPSRAQTDLPDLNRQFGAGTGNRQFLEPIQASHWRRDELSRIEAPA